MFQVGTPRGKFWPAISQANICNDYHKHQKKRRNLYGISKALNGKGGINLITKKQLCLIHNWEKQGGRGGGSKKD